MHSLIKRIYDLSKKSIDQGDDWIDIFRVLKKQDVNSIAVYIMLHDCFEISSKEADEMINKSMVWDDELFDLSDSFYFSMKYESKSTDVEESKESDLSEDDKAGDKA